MRLCVLAILWVFAPAIAWAQPAADTLRVAWRDAIPDVTPYYNQLRTGLILSNEVWDTLVYRDPETFQIKPALAVSWKQLDDTTIDFTLRPGVTFHNGDPFTASDVEYTVETVLTDPSVAVPSNYVYLAGAETLDPLHVRIKLQRGFPAALEYLAMTLPILPKAYRERVGASEFARGPVGTGPYRVTALRDGAEIDLERFAEHYQGSPKGRAAIRYVTIAQVPDSGRELGMLLNAEVDWIWQIDPLAVPAIANVPTLATLSAETMRVLYLSMDAAGRSDADTPLTKPAVRRAIVQAIDRRAFAANLVGAGARPLEAPCYPTQFGCDQLSVAAIPYDPEAARKTLADAGYPNGFHTELVSYLLPAWTEAIQADLHAIGIEARVVQLDAGAATRRSAEGRNPLYLGSWGSYSINDVSAFLPHFFTGGAEDYARDAEVEARVRAGGATSDIDQRRGNYAEAIHLITARALWLPLSSYVTTYAFSRALDFKPFPDELPRFYLAHWR